MKIAIDFDGTIVEQDKPYDQTDGNFTFVAGAKEALQSLKAAGHILLLWSARASKHHRFNVKLDPLYAAKPWEPRDPEKFYAVNQARFAEMVEFVNRELPGIFDAIDEGTAGKPTVDMFIDDRACRLGSGGSSWDEIQGTYGATSEPE